MGKSKRASAAIGAGYQKAHDPIGTWAAREIAALRHEGFWEWIFNIAIGAVPALVSLVLIGVSICRINSDIVSVGAFLRLAFDHAGIFNEKYQQWYIGMLTIFAASWGVVIARIPVLERRRADRARVKNAILVAEKMTRTLGYEVVVLSHDCNLVSKKLLTTDFFDISKQAADVPATLSISDQLFAIQEIYVDLKAALIEHDDVRPGDNFCVPELTSKARNLVWHIDQLLAPYSIESDEPIAVARARERKEGRQKAPAGV